MGDLKAVSDAYTEAFNSHDEARIRACYEDGATFTAPGGVALEGPEAITEYNMTWLRAFPDARVTLENEVIAGEWVATQGTFTGTHTETLSSPEGDIPATGKSVTGRAAELIRVVDGKIVEDHLYFDNMEVLTQLGLIPETATA
jgi:predicted ester cyclase